jgi:hypothetical protein
VNGAAVRIACDVLCAQALLETVLEKRHLASNDDFRLRVVRESLIEREQKELEELEDDGVDIARTLSPELDRWLKARR